MAVIKVIRNANEKPQVEENTKENIKEKAKDIKQEEMTVKEETKIDEQKEESQDDSDVLESIEKAASSIKKVESVKRSTNAEEDMVNMVIGSDTSSTDDNKDNIVVGSDKETNEPVVLEAPIPDTTVLTGDITSKETIKETKCEVIDVTGLNSEDESCDEENSIQEEVDAIQSELLTGNGKKSETSNTVINVSNINEDVEEVEVEDFVQYNKRLDEEAPVDNTDSLKEAKDSIKDFISYISTGALMGEIKKQSKKAGVSEKKVAKTVIQKFLGMIGDILGTTIRVIGDLFKSTVNVLQFILTKGASIIISVANTLVNFVTLGYTTKA